MPRIDEELMFRETYGEAPGWSDAEKEAPKGFGAPNRSATRVNAQHRSPQQRSASQSTFKPST